VRFSFLANTRDDWVTNDFTGREDLEGYEEYAARLQFLYQSDSPLEALLNVHARNLDGTARLFRANIITPGANQLNQNYDRRHVAMDATNFQKVDNVGASARLRWDFASVALHAVTGYETVDALSHGDIDGGFGAVFAPPFGPGFIPFPAETADGLPRHRQFTQEFRLESMDWGRLDWQAGLFWFDETISIDSFSYDTLAPGQPLNGYALQSQDNETWAVFGSLDFEMREDLVLRGGLRYTKDRKDFVAERFISPLSFLGVGPVGPLYARTSEGDISGDLSGTWSMSEDIKFYGRIARGFRAPSIQGRLLFGDELSVADSETVLSYEVGVKADLFDRRARVAFSLFNYTIKDQQLTAVGGASAFNRLINADESQGRGFELDVEAYVTDSVLMTFSTSYNDTEINDPNLFIQPCGGGCTVLDPPGRVPGTVSIDGNPLPQAPKWIYNFTARYGRPVGNDGEFFIYTDWSYRSKILFFLYESREYVGDPLLEGGLRVGYSWNYGLRELALFGRNILDEEELVGGIDFNNLTGFVNEPRIVGLEFTVRF